MHQLIYKFGKYFVAIFLIFLLWINLYMSSISRPTTNFSSTSKRLEDVSEVGASGGGAHGFGFWSVADNGLSGTPAFINVPESEALSPSEIEEISKEIELINRGQKIHNVDRFGEVGEGTFVIVIQVHSRVEYLALLVESLSRVPQIDNALVIFSHDLYNPGLNDAIAAIDFTRVMQIFYPHSIQLHPNQFPGQGENDCPRDVSPAKARELKCENFAHPDLHGHYREARYTQTKHHWWWKANFIFGGIDVLKNYTGVVAFLEEDHYVTPDFLWVLNLMETSMMRNLCQGCNLLALGTYLKTWNIRSSNNQGVVTNWVSSKHNMGMAFNRSLFNELQRCAPTFCNYDDYNWDWSLLPVSDNCLKSPLTVYFAKAPRIFHIGDCGIHHKKSKCDPSSSAQAIDKGVKLNSGLLFPDRLGVQLIPGKRIKLRKGNGGWGDIRDRKLCLAFTTIANSSTLKI